MQRVWSITFAQRGGRSPSGQQVAEVERLLDLHKSQACSARGGRFLSCALERQPEPGPRAHAALDHVDHLARAGTHDEARRGRGPLTRRAHDRDRPLRVEPVGQPVDVVPRRERRAGDVAGVVLRALADVEDLDELGVLAAAPRAASARRARSGASPAASSSCRRAGSRRAAAARPTARAAPPAARPRRRGPRTRARAAGSPIHASFEPKPAVSIGLQTAPGMWASSNCWSVRTSTSSAPAARLLLDLARRQRQHLDADGQQLAAVQRDDVLEVRRLRPEPGERLLDELVLVLDRERRVGRALVADRRGDLHVHPGAAAHRAAEVPGPHLALAAAASAACRAASGRSRARPRPSRSPGRAARRR